MFLRDLGVLCERQNGYLCFALYPGEPDFKRGQYHSNTLYFYRPNGDIMLLDESIPGLDGKTPREAIQTAEGRVKVEEMLKDWENMEERKRKDGEPYIDVDGIRKMLNL
jgi:hypothetical protein